MSDCVVSITAPAGPGAFLVALEGVIDSELDLARYMADLTGAVMIDLRGVARITSPGVRQWLSGVAALSADYVGFVRCTPVMMRQFNMIRGFAGTGQLISFYIPYECDQCSTSFELLVDLRHGRVRESAVAHHPCVSCGTTAELDEVMSYCDYATSQGELRLPPVANHLADRFAPELQDRLRISKELEADRTILRLHGSLRGGANLAPWFDGITGQVVVDLSAVPVLTPEGAKELLSSLSEAAEPVFEGARVAAVVSLINANSSAVANIASTLLAADCKRCHGRSEVVRRGGGSMELDCPGCGAVASLVVDPAEQRAVSEHLMHAAIEPDVRVEHVDDSTDISERNFGPNFIGKSSAFKQIVQTAATVAETKASVLIRGETGVGKEQLARYIHNQSKRGDRPFVAVNCAALSDGVLESELFGHEAGAFTGAATQRIGRFEAANGGTLFIDEVGDLPMSVQVKLLRTLQERQVERVGGNEAVPIDIRLIAATHRNLEEMIACGDFREDLFYRLNVVPIVVPPLRDRREDILPLAESYLAKFQEELGRSDLRLSAKIRRLLVEHDWPGNIRQLTNVIERMVALAKPNGELSAAGLIEGSKTQPLPQPSQIPSRRRTLRDSVADYERTLIEDALSQTNGNRAAAARTLGMSRQALAHKITKYGL